MITLRYRDTTAWENYHQTERFTARHVAQLETSAGFAALPILHRAAAAAVQIKRYIGDAIAHDHWAMPTGAKWSFNALAGSSPCSLDCASDAATPQSGLTGAGILGPLQLHHRAKTMTGGAIAMVLGGTRLRELVDYAEPLGYSLITSGTQLRATIAGVIGSASHGSRLDYGGIQNQIRGMHLITATNRSVWIERASLPCLADASARVLDPNIECIRNDAMFEDALIHLGGMGIVNAVAMQLGPNHVYRATCAKHPLTEDMFKAIEHGKFEKLATMLGWSFDPVFYELTLHPHFAQQPDAMAFHTMYHVCEAHDGCHVDAGPIPRAADIFSAFVVDQMNVGAAPEDAFRAPPPGTDIIDDFDAVEMFEKTYFDAWADKHTNVDAHWSQLHGDDITSEMPGALFNASFAVDRRKLGKTLRRMSAALADLKPHFVLTVRFVSHAAGTLAATQFRESAVIEIDGLSRLAYQILFKDIPDAAKQYPVQAERAVAQTRVALSGDDAIAHHMHWAKLGWWGDKQKVEDDYGPSNHHRSPVARWRRTRTALLDNETARVMCNHALIAFGLVDERDVAPAPAMMGGAAAMAEMAAIAD